MEPANVKLQASLGVLLQVVGMQGILVKSENPFPYSLRERLALCQVKLCLSVRLSVSCFSAIVVVINLFRLLLLLLFFFVSLLLAPVVFLKICSTFGFPLFPTNVKHCVLLHT